MCWKSSSTQLGKAVLITNRSLFENLFLTPNAVIHRSPIQPPVYTRSESVFVFDNVCLCPFVCLPTAELIWTRGLVTGTWVDACQMQLAGSSCSSSHRSEVLERTRPPACTMSGHLISPDPPTKESKKALCSDRCLRKTSWLVKHMIGSCESS